MLFYTGKGDSGSSTVGNKKIPKDAPILSALGELDELNSFLGLVRSQVSSKSLGASLRDVQETLFIVQAQVAGLMFSGAQTPMLSLEKVRALELQIEKIEGQLKPERGFVVSGSTEASAWLDVARTIARRAERAVNVLHGKQKVAPEILAYLNRLSSYLYALARQQAGKKEQHPSYT